MGDLEGLKAYVDTRLLKGIIEVEDTVDATITYKNGSSCLFYATNNYVVDSPIELEIICEKAVFKVVDKLVITYSDGTVEQVTETDKAAGGKAYWGCSHKYLIQNFHERLQDEKTFELTGEQGITAIQIIEAIYRSSETGSYIKLC